MYARANFWSVFNPTGKTSYERKRVYRFEDLEQAQEWVNDGRRAKHNYLLRFVPYYKETCYDNWCLDRTDSAVKEIFKNF